MTTFNIQFPRTNGEIIGRGAAIEKLKAQVKLYDGSPVVIRYREDQTDSAVGEKAILGIAYKTTGSENAKFAYVDLDSDKSRADFNKALADAKTALEAQINALQVTSEGKTILRKNGTQFDIDVNIDGKTIVKDASTGKLSVAQSAMTQYVGENAVKVSDTPDTSNNKKISLQIDSANKILSQSANGLLASLSLEYSKDSHVIRLIGYNNQVIGTVDTTDFVVDGFLDSVNYSTESGKGNILVFTFNAGAKKTPIEVDLSKYIDAYAAGNGIALNSSNKEFSIKLKDSEKYLETTNDGLSTKGIDAAITTQVEELEKTVVKEVEVNGVAATLSNAAKGKQASVAISAENIKTSSTSSTSIAQKLTELDAKVGTNGSISTDLQGDGLEVDANKKLKVKIADTGTDTQGLDKFIQVTPQGLKWITDANGVVVFDGGTFN